MKLIFMKIWREKKSVYNIRRCQILELEVIEGSKRKRKGHGSYIYYYTTTVKFSSY